ncbi:MAG: SRPBCC domain-containing protein [Pseudomonadota bacterium]
MFDARYIAISAPDRMVYSYTMATPDALLSASLSTVVLTADEAGTRLEYTEQAVFLDGGDRLETRRAGTEMMFERMARVLEREAA